MSWTTNFGSGRFSNNTSLVSVLLIISLEISFASCLSDSSNKLSSSINISSIFGLASKIGLLSKISWINSSKWYCFFCSVAAVSVSLNFVASSKNSLSSFFVSFSIVSGSWIVGSTYSFLVFMRSSCLKKSSFNSSSNFWSSLPSSKNSWEFLMSLTLFFILVCLFF